MVSQLLSRAPAWPSAPGLRVLPNPARTLRARPSTASPPGRLAGGLTFFPLGRQPQLLPGLTAHLQPVDTLPKRLQFHAGIQGLQRGRNATEGSFLWV